MAKIGIQRLASQIRYLISDALMRKLNDPRLDRMASITHVEITADLAFADIRISVMGNDSQQQLFMKAMNSAHGKLQSMVAKHLKTRTCPMLRFHLDQSIKKSMQTLQLIEKSMADIAERESANNSSDSEDSNSDKNHS